MKKLILFSAFVFVALCCFSQTKPYNEDIDAVEQINSAVKQAKAEQKYVLVQVGGNWCPWCLRFAELAQSNEAIKNVIDSNYVYIHVNYSKKNKNEKAMAMLDNPTRFGFPVFVILDENGKRIHTQNSVYLEEGKGYSEKLAKEFLEIWMPTAVKTIKR